MLVDDTTSGLMDVFLCVVVEDVFGLLLLLDASATLAGILTDPSSPIVTGTPVGVGRAKEKGASRGSLVLTVTLSAGFLHEHRTNKR